MLSASRAVVVRLAVAALVLLAVYGLTFALMRAAPGGPFTSMHAGSAAVRSNLDARFGLDKPVPEQFVTVLAGYLALDFGPSLTFAPGVPVASVLGDSLPVSMELGAWALLLALLVGVGLGALAGLRPGSWTDRAVSAGSTLVVSASVIVIAAIVRSLFVVHLRWFPAGGFTESASGKVLPVVTLGLAYAAIFVRLVRGAVASAVGGRLLAGAMARGVPYRAAVLKYVLPAALVPLLGYMGTAAAGILTGSFVVETIFEVPGMAACFVSGAAARDYTLVSGAILVYAALLMGLNFLFETLHEVVDPRRGRAS